MISAEPTPVGAGESVEVWITSSSKEAID
jgi:hypothetical protein